MLHMYVLCVMFVVCCWTTKVGKRVLFCIVLFATPLPFSCHFLSAVKLLLHLVGRCIHGNCWHQLHHWDSLGCGGCRGGWAGGASWWHIVRCDGYYPNGWRWICCWCWCWCCWFLLMTLTGRQHKTLPNKLISFETRIRRWRPAIELNARIWWNARGLGQMRSHKSARLHALAVGRNAIARELGAATATCSHQAGIGSQRCGRWAAGSWSNDINAALLIHRLAIAWTETELALKGLQLLHEVKVWRHIRFAGPHHHEGIVQTDCLCVHQIGECHRHRPWDARKAVDQHRRICWARFLCKRIR